MKKLAALLVLTLAIAAGPAWAIDAPIDEATAKLADNDSYLVKTPGMLVHGAYELAESPLETLNQPVKSTVEDKDYAFGLFKGINRGAYNFLEGATRGVFNIFRSFVPGMGRYQKTDHQKKILPVLAG